MLIAGRRGRGFTIIEIMIALGIAGLLMALGLPAFRDFLANSKIRSTAETLQAGLQLARSEAINRNRTVQFLLFDDTDYDAGEVGTVTANASGPNYVIRVQDPVTLVFTQIDWRNGYEGSGQANTAPPTTTIAATYPTMALGGTANIITFKGLGGTLLGGTANFDVTNASAGACTTSGTPSPIRCLRVQVTVSGQIRMCDPAVASTDTRYCS